MEAPLKETPIVLNPFHEDLSKYQPSSTGVTRSLLTMPHLLQHLTAYSLWEYKLGDRVWKSV